MLDVIRELAATGSADGVVVAPISFTSDHLELRYDLDIDALRRRRGRGWPSPAPTPSATMRRS
ncbi:MAG: ferrochelatase [Acidimicrobiales bacterium]